MQNACIHFFLFIKKAPESGALYFNNAHDSSLTFLKSNNRNSNMRYTMCSFLSLFEYKYRKSRI